MNKSSKLLAVGISAIFSLLLASCSSIPPAEQSAPSATTSSDSPRNSASPVTNSKDDPLDNGGYAEYTWDDFVKAKKKASGLTSWPEVERVRYVSMEEWPEEQASCLTNLGFPATVEPGGDSFTVKNTDDQQTAFDEASYICALQYPQDLKYAQALTRTQWRIYYAYYRDSLIPCLQGLGLEPGTLPSEATFVEGMATGSETWDPFTGLDISSVDTDELNQKCPSSPPAEDLYGS